MDEAVNEFLDGDGCHLLDFLVESVRANCSADIEIHLKSMCTAHIAPTSTTSTDSINADVRLVERRISRAAMYVSKTDAFKRLKLDIVARCRKLARLRCDVLENDYSEHSFAGNSTFGLDLAQSTRFPGDSDTTNIVEQLEDPETSTQQRITLLNSLLSLSTSAIGKKKHLTRLLGICKQTIMEESTLTSTLVLLKKLFNTKDSDIVSEVLCSLISSMSSVLHSSLSEGGKLKVVMLLFKMMCICPALWPRFQPQAVSKMISSLIQYIGSVDIKEMSICNLMAILAALDPRANWMRSWAHALPSREVMRASLPCFASKAKNFLHDRPECDSLKYQSVFLHYSPKELLILLYTNLCSVLFIWMKYDDLYAIFGNDEWTQILESVVNREFDRSSKSSSNKTIAKLLYEVAYCRTPAEFLLSISAVRILARIRSICGIRIIRIALTVSSPSDLSVPLICAEINRHISNHSRAKRYEALLCLSLLASRVGWGNLESHIHCEFIECTGDEEINRVVRQIRAVRDIYMGDSLAQYLKCESACKIPIPSHFVAVTSADQRLVVSKIMDLYMREADATESFIEIPTQVQLSAQLAALVWQPQIGVDLLKCFDCSFLLQNLINKAYEVGDSSALVMLRVFTLNLDVAIELRSQAKMLRRLFQAIIRWNSKEIGAWFDSVSIETFALFASIMIGGPSEVGVNQSLTSSIIRNPRSLIKLLYIASESCGSSQEQVPVRSLDEVIEIMEKDRSYSAVEVLTFLASTVSVGNGILITRRMNTSGSADQFENDDYPLVQECTALLDYAIYLKLITTRKHGRRLLPQLRIPYLKHRKECDWFFNVVFLMLKMDVHLTNFVCSRLIHHENAVFFWPTANMRFAHYVESYPYAIVVEMLKTPRLRGIKRIFERELVSLYHLFLLLSNQVYLNVLDWPNVCRYVVLSIAEGPGFQARHFCAVLLHVEEHLRHYSSRGNLLPLITNFKQLSSFNFSNYASLVDDLYKKAYAQHDDDQQ